MSITTSDVKQSHPVATDFQRVLPREQGLVSSLLHFI